MIKRTLLYLFAGIIASVLFVFRRSVWMAIKSPTPLVLLIAVLILILLILAFIFFIFRSARKKDSPPPQADEEPVPKADDTEKQKADEKSAFPARKLRSSFAREVRSLKANVSGRNIYQIPWFLMVGEASSGKTTVLGENESLPGLAIPIRGTRKTKSACKWFSFEKGIILDIAGGLVLRKDSEGSDRKRWHSLLRLLQKYRPKRPMDGLILTLPCTDLIAPEGWQNASVLNMIAEKADTLYSNLRDAQKTVGMRFPIYVLVTKCDQIQGFESFCQGIPAQLHHHILGWSSPYAVDTAYSTDWVDEAFQRMNRELFRTQFEMFTEGTDPGENDGLYLFPSNFRAIAEPLRIYLDRIFKQTVYHESFILRGLYFCGDNNANPTREARAKPLFVKDLFEKKIFPEFRIAKPLENALLMRNRKVLGAQIAAVLIVLVSILGLWGARQHLQRDKNAMMPGFSQIREDLRKFSHAPDELNFERSGQNLFDSMDNLRGLKYFFIPPSWFSGVREKIRQSMFRAYNEIVVKAILKKLKTEAEAIFKLSSAKPSISADDTKVRSLEKNTPFIEFCKPEFIELYRFAEGVSKLQEIADKYNAFCKSKNRSEELDNLDYVVEELFGKKLPESFHKNIQSYEKDLRKSEYDSFNYGIFKIKAGSEELESLTDKLYDRLFHSDAITKALRLEELSRKLDFFAQQKRSSSRDGELILELMERISQTEINLSKPKFSWISKDAPDLGESFENILSMIGNSHFFGSDLRSEIEKDGNSAFRKLKKKLGSEQAVFTGPLLDQRGGEVIMALSPATLALKADLGALLNQPFMAIEQNRGQSFKPPPGTMFSSWNTDMLRDALEIFKPYEEYVKSEKKKSSTGLQKTIIRDTAKSTLERKVRSMIAQARQLRPVSDGWGNQPRETFDDQLDEVAVLKEVRNFKEAEKIFDQMLIQFREFGLTDAETELLALLSKQSVSLLNRVGDFLEDENIYRIKGDGFSWWNGEETPSLAAFDVIDDKELEYHLGLQRERIRHLAYEYAEPLITFNTRRNQVHTSRKKGGLPRRQKSEAEKTLFKWKTILSALEDYENKKPSNSVTDLERFILFDMNAINEKNYFEKISQKDLSEQSSDIFLQRKNELRKMLYERCEEFAAKRIIEEYTEIREFFEAKLEGRFPFLSIDGRKVFSEVNPRYIREFYEIFDEEVTALKDVLAINKQFGFSGRQALGFLNQMEKVRHFFVPYIEGGEDKDGNKKELEFPTVDIDVEFRVNRGREHGANSIIDWNLSVGDQELRYGEDKLTARWQFGDPVTLSFRWAKNALDSPDFAREPAGGKVTDNKMVRYEFSNQWSLIRFLVGSGFRDKSGHHILQFVIDTLRTGIDGQEEKSQATAFIRVAVLTPDKAKKVLDMPAFPEKAPELIWTSDSYAGFEPPSTEKETLPQDAESENTPGKKEDANGTHE